MTYRYKTRTRLPLNTGYRAGHTYDKAQRTIKRMHNNNNNGESRKHSIKTTILENYIQKIYPLISIMPQYNISQTLVQYIFSFFFRAIYKPTIKSKNKSSWQKHYEHKYRSTLKSWLGLALAHSYHDL